MSASTSADAQRPPTRGPRPIVGTPAIAAVREAAKYVVDRAGALVVYGDHGTGRTTAVRAYLERQELPWHVIDLPPNPDELKITGLIYRAIVGPDHLPLREMQDDLVDALQAERRVIVLRHAERLTSRAAGQIQWLHDRPGAMWTLILIGDSDVGTAVRRDPLLAHTITSAVQVRPLTDRDLLRVVQSLDSLFMNADPRLLLAIDKQRCKGNLATWSRFLDCAQWLTAHHPDPTDPLRKLDKQLAQAALGHMTSLPKARK